MTEITKEEIYEQGVIDGIEFALSHRVMKAKTQPPRNDLHSILIGDFDYLATIMDRSDINFDLYKKQAKKDLIEFRRYPYPWEDDKGGFW